MSGNPNSDADRDADLGFMNRVPLRIRGGAQAAKSAIVNKRTALCAALLIAAGAALRLYPLADIPPGVNQDEASALYDAWSLLHYGIDRSGASWPVHFVAWGSGQSVLYPYIAMPFIWIGGLDIAVYRLPMAILGAASLWLMWRVAQNAAGDRFALLALLFLAFNLWHAIATRWALDSTMLPFCVLLSVYFFSRHDRHRFAIQALAVAALSASVYAYGTAYAFAPLFLAAAFGWLALNRALTMRRLLALSAIAAAIAAPIVLFLIVNLFDLDSVRILGLTFPRYPAQARYEVATLLFGWDWERFFDNLRRLADLLLGSRDRIIPYAHYEMRGWGALAFMSVLMAAGLAVVAHRAVARRDFGVHLLVATWFVLALGIGTFVDANANRANLLWLPVIYLSAWGVATAFRQRAALCAAAAAFIALSGLFAAEYFREYEDRAPRYFNKGLDAAISRAVETTGEGELIYISREVNQPYIHALYAAAAPPRQYLETRVVDNPGSHIHRVLAFDRFVFLSPFRQGAPQPTLAEAQFRERQYRNLRIAGVSVDAIDRYIFQLPAEAADVDALAPDEYIVERHGIFAYAYPKDGGSGGAGAVRLDAPLVQGEPTARAEFDLRLQDGELIYFKRPCGERDARERFFLRVFPADISDIPEERRERGFESLNFWFRDHGALYGDQCLASVPLPDYAIAAIETGQSELTRDWPIFWRESWKRLWTAELKF